MIITDFPLRKLAALVALAVVITGCSHRSATPAASGGAAVLSCHDSAGQQPADPQAQPVNGVESFELNGDTNAYDTLPAWMSRDGHRYLVWKTYLAVAASARPYRIVTVTSPATARLFNAFASPMGCRVREPGHRCGATAGRTASLREAVHRLYRRNPHHPTSLRHPCGERARQQARHSDRARPG